MIGVVKVVAVPVGCNIPQVIKFIVGEMKSNKLDLNLLAVDVRSFLGEGGGWKDRQRPEQQIFTVLQ